MSPPSERVHDPVTAWARGALDGKIVVGELVAAAAERHLRDLRDGPSRGLYWSLDAATRPLRFLPAMLSITEGAKVDGPFEPLPWHVFCAGSIFGWRRASGRMRHRSRWLEQERGIYATTVGYGAAWQLQGDKSCSILYRYSATELRLYPACTVAGAVYFGTLMQSGTVPSGDAIRLRISIVRSGDNQVTKVFGDWATTTALLTATIPYSSAHFILAGYAGAVL